METQAPESDQDWLSYTTQPVPIFADLMHDLQLASIDRSILSFREDSSHKSTAQTNLFSKLLMTRFLVTFEIGDFGEALELQYSLFKTRKDDPSYTLRGSNATLSSTLDMDNTAEVDDVQVLEGTKSTAIGDFRQAIDVAKLDSCISLYRQLVTQHTNGTSAVRNRLSRNDLAYSLLIAYIATGQLSHLEESILLYRHLVTEIPSSLRIFPLLCLAGGLVMRLTHVSDDAPLEEAALLVRQFSTAFNDRNAIIQQAKSCSKQGYDDPRKLNEAISLYSEAIAFVPIRHQDRPALLVNLALVLSPRYFDNRQLSDLEHEIRLYKDAIKCYSNIPGLSTSLGDTSENLAQALLRLYKVTHLKTHLNDAMDAFREAINSVNSENSPESTLPYNKAKEWAQSAHIYRHPSAMEAYRCAMKLLPQFSFLGQGNFLTRRSNMASVTADGLACSAASCAIEMGELREAVEILEARSVFWTQAMQLKAPLDDLMAISPALAERLQTTTKILEESSLLKRTTGGAVSTSDKDMLYLRKINAQHDETLNEIRQLEGFHDFLLPKTFSSLIHAASNGPVIILMAAVEASGCDAMILTSDGCFHLPLPTIDHIEVGGLVSMLRSALSSKSARYTSRDMNQPGEINNAESEENDVGQHRLEGKRVKTLPTSQEAFRTVLSALWKHVVNPVIKHLKLQKTQSPPRVWWYPTGLFASLPIHASGIYYPEDGDLECASDYLVSSYTPNLSTLLPPNRKGSQRGPFKMLAVIQADVPGQPHLDLFYTREELNRIRNHIPSANLVAFGTPDNPSSIDKVLTHLDESSIVHFACHGSQSVDNPLESSLLLADGNLKISQIINRSMSNASLAFLSACETAKGDRELPDEFIHIATTMLFAGFPSVVATMWSIRDDDAPGVADDFYRHMLPKIKVKTAEKPIVKETFFEKVLHRFCIPKHTPDEGTSKKPEATSAPALPDTTQAAVALHLAVAKLRAQKDCTFQRWVPFIHLGL